MEHKPFSPACERNQDAILAVLRAHFADRTQVLEIGSGTGQHAVQFAAALPHLIWQTSDVPAYLPGIRQWLGETRLSNTPPPLAFDVNGTPPANRCDAVFTANTLHIMGWRDVQRLFETLPTLMQEGALLTVYGPFKYAGRFTGPGDAAFDASLRADHPQRGIRDAEQVDALARAAGLVQVDDRAMPAANRCITWRRPSG